jgi:hypothetical protein
MLTLLCLVSVMLNIIYAVCHIPAFYVECLYAGCLYSECHCAECHCAECHYAECIYTECRSFFILPYLKPNRTNRQRI